MYNVSISTDLYIEIKQKNQRCKVLLFKLGALYMSNQPSSLAYLVHGTGYVLQICKPRCSLHASKNIGVYLTGDSEHAHPQLSVIKS